MNINEVEKHVKSEFIITIILYILTGLTMIVSIIAIVTTDVKALTDTDISSSIYTGTQHTVTSQPGMAMADATVTNDTYSTITQNTWTSDVYSIYFQVNTGISASSNVTIRINTSSTLKNLRYTCNSTHVSCTAQYISNNQLNINFSTGSSPVTYAGFFISTETSSPISGNDLFRWTSVRLLTNAISSGGSGGSSSSFDDTGIINNANQNTNTIIDNNNSNTQEIINNNNTNTQSINNGLFSNANRIIEQLASMCPNGIDLTKLVNCDIRPTGAHYNCDTTISDVNVNTGSLSMSSSNSWRGIATDYIPVASGGTYYFKFNWTSNVSNRLFYNIYRYDKNKNILTGGVDGTWANNRSFSLTYNVPVNTHYIRITIRDATANFSDTISGLYFGSKNQSYCVYGSSNENKLDDISNAIGGVATGVTDVKNVIDDVKDIQQDTYDYMTDDTTPTVDTNEINNVISGVQINNPLSYLLTLPLHLISKINQIFSVGTCSPVDLGAFGFASDYHFRLPCINFENYLGSSLWNTIDVFVSIGLLAFTLYKIYHAVANILTLGGEDEVTHHLGYLSPMEFLAQIIGGGGFGVVVGKGNV